jgi:DNA-binding transcriptional MerR regulator
MGKTLQKQLPFKLFYKIGEASKIVGVEPYVLRFWEKEFPFLMPKKTKGGQRLFTKKEIELLLQIKQMLYEEKYTIEGVRKKLNKIYQSMNCRSNIRKDTLEKVKIKLKEILEILS